MEKTCSEYLIPPFKDEDDYPSNEGFEFVKEVEQDKGCNYIIGIFSTPEEAQAWVAVQVASLKKYLDTWRNERIISEVLPDEKFEI